MRSALRASLPQDCNDSLQVHFFDNQTLYLYINGGADLFLTYGFKRLYSAACTVDTKGMGITLDIYDMSDERNACEIFKKKCPQTPSELPGYDAVCGGNSFILGWKGRYYIEIQTNGSPFDDANLLHTIAQQLADHLP